mmetsp:Transcript_45432/g.72654  ORF Transcript_45432/g.72654 Transcript_45432/m.72654 type:complete len:108 (-) Transcript_45432:421-744(-)
MKLKQKSRRFSATKKPNETNQINAKQKIANKKQEQPEIQCIYGYVYQHKKNASLHQVHVQTQTRIIYLNPIFSEFSSGSYVSLCISLSCLALLAVICISNCAPSPFA